VILHPYHDDGGRLYPESDDREVGIETMAAYVALSRVHVWKRANDGAYGRTKSDGAWVQHLTIGKRGRWRFRPAVIWRRLGLGRYGIAGFDPRQITQRIYCCDPADTVSRRADPSELPPDLLKVLQSLSGAHLETMSLLRRMVPSHTAQHGAIG